MNVRELILINYSRTRGPVVGISGLLPPLFRKHSRRGVEARMDVLHAECRRSPGVLAA